MDSWGWGSKKEGEHHHKKALNLQYFSLLCFQKPVLTQKK